MFEGCNFGRELIELLLKVFHLCGIRTHRRRYSALPIRTVYEITDCGASEIGNAASAALNTKSLQRGIFFLAEADTYRACARNQDSHLGLTCRGGIFAVEALNSEMISEARSGV